MGIAHVESRAKSLKKRLLFGAAALALAGIIWWLWPLASDVPVFSVDGRGRYLQVRYEYPDMKTLLITRANDVSPGLRERSGTVYRYDPLDRTLVTAGKEDWIHADGEVRSADWIDLEESDFDIYKYGLQLFAGKQDAKTRLVNTIGKKVLSASVMPRKEMFHAVTTNSRERFGIRGIFISIGGGYAGQHYVELFSVPDSSPVKPPIRIPFTNAHGIDVPCMSEDGRYIVFASGDRQRMLVIHTDPDETKAPGDAERENAP